MKNNFNLHKKITVSVYFMFGLLIMVLSRIPANAQTTIPTSPQPVKGFPAVDFSLQSMDGKFYHLHDFTGKVVIVNFWASWCPPCRVEMPTLQKLFNQFQNQDIVILTLNVTNQDSIQNVNQFIREKQLTLPILLDTDGKISKLYQIQSLPTTFIINPKGIIEDIIIGGPISETLLLIRIQQAQGK